MIFCPFFPLYMHIINQKEKKEGQDMGFEVLF